MRKFIQMFDDLLLALVLVFAGCHTEDPACALMRQRMDQMQIVVDAMEHVYLAVDEYDAAKKIKPAAEAMQALRIKGQALHMTVEEFVARVEQDPVLAARVKGIAGKFTGELFRIQTIPGCSRDAAARGEGTCYYLWEAINLIP